MDVDDPCFEIESVEEMCEALRRKMELTESAVMTVDKNILTQFLGSVRRVCETHPRRRAHYEREK